MRSIKGYQTSLGADKPIKKLSPNMEYLRKAMGGILPVISESIESRGTPIPPAISGARLIWPGPLPVKRGWLKISKRGCSWPGLFTIWVSIPAEILNKPGKLSKIEYKLIQAHSQTGHDILKDIDFPWPLAEIVLQHHERLNGSGYPRGLKGKVITPEAQILMVADVVEAMSSCRPYRPALGVDAALEEIEKNKGILYDQEVVEVCARLFREKEFGFE